MNEVKKIAGLTFVCNEDDILEQFVRHNLPFLDVLHVIIDVKSVDNSRIILQSLVNEGLPLTLEEGPAIHEVEPRSAFVQKYDYWAYVFIDDDEFLAGITPTQFKALLYSQTIQRQIWLPWKTYLPERSYDPQESMKLELRREREEPQYYKVAYVRAKLPMVHKIADGAHSVIGLDEVVRIEGVFLAHYPVRSYRQVLLKYVASEFQHLFLSKWVMGKTHGWHLKKGFEDLVARGSLTYEELFREGYYYCSKASREKSPMAVVKDSVEIFVEKRYLPCTESDLELTLKLISNVFNVFRSKSEQGEKFDLF